MDERPRERADGQVSEAGSLDDAGTAETPSDAVAGHPTDDDVQEGRTGPNARTGDQEPDESSDQAGGRR